MKKVLLINPFLSVYKDDPAGICPPLGLAYLASYLEKEGVEVKILDIAAEGINEKINLGKKVRYGLCEKEITGRVKEFSPQIVGIACQSTLHATEAHETAGIIKKAQPEILTIMGGAHPSAVPEEVLKDKNIDIVVRGEGEVTLGEIVTKYSSKNKWSEIKGISWRKNQKIIHNPQRPFINNLDSLPFPARHLLPMEIYSREYEKGVNYNLKKKFFTMITSRGCPGNCVYCAVKAVWGRTWRGRSPANVVDEIETLIRDYQAEEIHFLDDSISVDKKRLEEICQEIIRRKLRIRWTTPNGIAIWLLDRNLLKKMKKAGCYRLTFGLESGSPEILKNFIGKHYNHQEAKEMITFASQLGLWTVGTFILGFPHETHQQIEETINFSVSSDLDFATFYIANPFPGTPLFEIYQKENLLPQTGAYDLVRGCRSQNFSHEELISLQSLATFRFLKSRLRKPSLLLRKLKSLESCYYGIRLGGKFFQIFLKQTLIKSRGIAFLWR